MRKWAKIVVSVSSVLKISVSFVYREIVVAEKFSFLVFFFAHCFLLAGCGEINPCLLPYSLLFLYVLTALVILLECCNIFYFISGDGGSVRYYFLRHLGCIVVYFYRCCFVDRICCKTSSRVGQARDQRPWWD